jgi:hypothetical protein
MDPLPGGSNPDDQTAGNHGNGRPGWPGAVVAIITLLVANGWSVVDVKTVLAALLGLMVVHTLWSRRGV